MLAEAKRRNETTITVRPRGWLKNAKPPSDHWNAPRCGQRRVGERRVKLVSDFCSTLVGPVVLMIKRSVSEHLALRIV